MQNIFHYEEDFLPNTIIYKRKDTHGRGLRGIIIPPNLMGYRTKQKYFEQTIIDIAKKAQAKWPQITKIEFCTQNVPPSDPAPWEGNEIILGRTFDQDWTHNLPARIVLYKLPILARAKNKFEIKNILQDIICQQLSYILNISDKEVL